MTARRWCAALTLATAAALAGCGGGDEASQSTTTTSAPTTAVAPSTTSVVASTTAASTTAPVPATTSPATTQGPPSPTGPCSGQSVPTPAVIAIRADDGSSCWSALSNWNAYVVAVADGKVLAVGGPCPNAQLAQALVALDVATGAELWHLEPDAQGADQAPEMRRYFGTGQSVIARHAGPALTGVDLADGHVLWTREGVLLLADGPDEVVVTMGDPTDHLIAVLDRRTGEERWRIQTEADVYAAGADEAVVVLSSTNETAAYDVHTGAHRWTAPPISLGGETPGGLLDGVVVGLASNSQESELRALDEASGAQLWATPGAPPQEAAPSDHNVYVQRADLSTQALDARTGAVRWTTPPPTAPTIGLNAGPGLVVQFADPAAGPAATIDALEPASGARRWTRPVAELGFPAADVALPSGFTPSYAGVLPTSAGVFFSFGNCLGN